MNKKYPKGRTYFAIVRMSSKFVTLALLKFWNPVEKIPPILFPDTIEHQSSFFASQTTPRPSTFGVLFLNLFEKFIKMLNFEPSDAFSQS